MLDSTHDQAEESDEDYLARYADLHTDTAIGKVRDLAESSGPANLSRRQALLGLSKMGSVVYAISTRDSLVKIGFTRNFGRRVQSLKLDQVLGFKFGTLADEQAIHRQLSAHAVKGREWYAPHPDVLAVINEWRAAVGRDPITQLAA